MLQQGVYRKFQGISDPTAVLGHQLMVRKDDFFQIQLPLTQVGDIAQGLAVPGAFLHIARVEIGDDGAHQCRRLAADVSLPVHQQLIEERQRLHLLRQAQIQGVGFDNPQIGSQPPPIRLAPGLLQQLGKAP